MAVTTTVEEQTLEACPIVPEELTPVTCDKEACMFNTFAFKKRHGCIVRLSAAINSVGFSSPDEDSDEDKKSSAGVHSPERRAAMMGSHVGKTRNTVEIETAALHRMAAEFREALDTPTYKTGECPNCGYLRPCSTKHICAERYDALDDLMPTLEGTLSRFQVWTAVKTNRATFLTKELQHNLKELLAAVDA